jgi:hypothetical protein
MHGRLWIADPGSYARAVSVEDPEKLLEVPRITGGLEEVSWSLMDSIWRLADSESIEKNAGTDVIMSRRSKRKKNWTKTFPDVMHVMTHDHRFIGVDLISWYQTAVSKRSHVKGCE